MSSDESTLAFYRHLVIRNSVCKPTRLELWKLERTLGARLPRQFRSFLNVGNGGFSVYSVNIPPLPEGESIGFSSIYCTRREVKESFPRETFFDAIGRHRQYKTIPRQVLPIAHDGMGSEFYLDLGKERYGRIVVFLHGLPGWTGRQQNDTCIELSRSFDEFVDLLYIEEEIAKDMLQEVTESGDDKEIAIVKTILDRGFPDWRGVLGFSD
jgi:hypothetical protein